MAQIFKVPKKKRHSRSAPIQNKSLRVDIDSLDHKGIGVARHQGRVVFVDGALPGEQCEVTIRDEKSRFLQADVIKVLSPSTDRLAPFCAHFSLCGGCQTQHAQTDAMLRFKQQAVDYLVAQKLPQSAGNTLPWQASIVGTGKAYRRKTRLSVDARNRDKISLGFRRSQSKHIVNISQCEILVPELQNLIAPLHQLLNALRNPSAVSHISLINGENLVQVCFRHTKTLAEGDVKLLTQFAENSGCQVLLEDNQGNNAFLSLAQKRIHYLAQQDVQIEFEPNDFIQVNDRVNQNMIQQALAWLDLDEQDQVLDLFCGVGNFSLPLARRCKRVIGVEGVAKMVQKASQNAQLNGIENVDFYQADLNAEQALHKKPFSQINKILLDPAREGASGIIELLKTIAASHILYVSCNPSTFARDAEHILQQGFQLEKIGLMDMFPNTAHTELMALFTRHQ